MRLVLNASVFHNGVSVKHEICWAMDIIDQNHKLWFGRDAEFTSLVDGKHSETSLHYAGLAGDLRIWYMKDLRDKFVIEIVNWLGPRYDVVLEENHVHFEFQPKWSDIK